jgi:Ca-activated chloride channel homolog
MARQSYLIVCTILLTLLFGWTARVRCQNEDTPIKVNTTLLNIPVIVTDRMGMSIPGLKREDFKIVAGGQEQQIEFFSDAEMPLTVAIVMDVTGSVSAVFSGIKKAAKEFVDRLGPEDQGMVVTFGEKVKVLQSITSDKKKLKDRISGADKIPGGIALMNSALLEIVRGEFAQVNGRKAIIVITDAGEINGTTTRELLDDLIEGDTVVYPVYFPTPHGWSRGRKNWTLDELVKQTPVGRLQDIASFTGGKLLVANGTEFGPQFQQITDELKRMYVIGFYPETGNAKGPTNIEIGVRRDGAVVRTKSIIRTRRIKATP